MTNRCWNFKNPSIESWDMKEDNIYGHHCASLNLCQNAASRSDITQFLGKLKARLFIIRYFWNKNDWASWKNEKNWISLESYFSMTEWIRTKNTCEAYAIGNRNLVIADDTHIDIFYALWFTFYLIYSQNTLFSDLLLSIFLFINVVIYMTFASLTSREK